MNSLYITNMHTLHLEPLENSPEKGGGWARGMDRDRPEHRGKRAEMSCWQYCAGMQRVSGSGSGGCHTQHAHVPIDMSNSLSPGHTSIYLRPQEHSTSQTLATAQRHFSLSPVIL